MTTQRRALQSSGMKRLDGYLTRKAQAVFPTATVYCDEAGPVQVWTLERGGAETIGLGGSFRSAHGAVVALVKAEKAKGGLK